MVRSANFVRLVWVGLLTGFLGGILTPQFAVADATQSQSAHSAGEPLDTNFEISCRELGDDSSSNLRFEVDKRENPQHVRCYWPFLRAARTVRIFKIVNGERRDVGAVSMCRAEILADHALYYADSESGFKLVVEGTPKLLIKNQPRTEGHVEYRAGGKNLKSSLVCERN